MYLLNEDNRNQLISKSKSSVKGKQRYDRRNKSKVSNTSREFNSIDMNKLFKKDILTVDVPVQGETDKYNVKISFGGFLDILKGYLKNKDIYEYRDISRACITGFNKDDVYIHCTCKDFKYRYNFHSSRNNTNSGEPETRPSKITNPNDTLGSGCKHILLVLSNTSWILRVARVINNYIHYMEDKYPKMYADLIYPAIFGKEYEDSVQLTFDDTDELDTSKDTIDVANDYNKKRTQFQKGNTKGIRFAKDVNKKDDNQISLEEIPNEDDL